MAASTVVVNGAKYDYASLTINIAIPGKGSLGIFEGISAIDYSAAIEREKFWGTSRTPIFATDGFADGDGSMTMARAWFDKILDFCKQNGLGYAEVQMNISVTYGNKNSPTKTDTLTKVKFEEIAQGHEQGAPALVADLTLFVEGQVLLNGVPAYAA